MAKYCPECGDLIANKPSCMCGWTDPDRMPSSAGRAGGRNKPVPVANHHCAAHRCPMPGSRTDSTAHKNASDVNWLCRFHYAAKNEPHLWPAITDDLISGKTNKAQA